MSISLKQNSHDTSKHCQSHLIRFGLAGRVAILFRLFLKVTNVSFTYSVFTMIYAILLIFSDMLAIDIIGLP